MITFVDVGKKLNERADSINLLFVAGFLLLIFQPFLVWDIGFQLSFAAMLGILYLMKPIHNMLYVKKKWVDNFIWTPSALSLSAQLGTTPLSFFYFGNFPVLFLLTNIIILMPVTIAMYLGILLLVSSAILPYGLNILIGKLLDAILYYGFDLPLQWIVTLPSAYIDKIYLLPWQVAVLMLSILFFGIWLYHLKKGKYLVLSLSFLVVSFLGGVYREFQNSQLIKINILHVPGSHAVAVNNYIWSGNENAYSLISDNEFHLGGYLRVGGWKVWTAFPPDFVQSDSNLLIVGDKSIYFLNQNLNEFDNTHKIEVGYLVLGDNFFLDVKKLKEIFDFRYLVLDGKLPYSKYMLFKRLLEKESIDFMDTREDGALEILL